MKNTLNLIVFMLALSIAFYSTAQETSKEGKAVIKIIKDENGKTTQIDTTIQFDENTNIQEILKQLGVEEDISINIDEDGENIDVEVQSDGKTKTVEKSIIFLDSKGNIIKDGKTCSKSQSCCSKSKSSCCSDPNKGFFGVLIDLENKSDKGLKVQDVVENSAAKDAGLQGGDVITQINKTKIRSFDDLKAALKGLKTGDAIKVKYLHNNKKKSAKATLKAKPKQSAARSGGCCSKSDKSASGCNGFDKEKLQRHLKMMEGSNKARLGVFLNESYGKGGNGNGVLVDKVSKKSGAAEAGLQAGDIILKVEGKDVNDAGSIGEILKDKKVDDVVAVSYKRNNTVNTVNVTLKGGSMMPDFKQFDWKGLKGHDDKDFMWKDKMDFKPNKVLLGVFSEEMENGKGVIIKEIVKESAAEEAGLLAGDIITAIDGKNVNSTEELLDVLSNYNPQDKIKVSYIRTGKNQSLDVVLKENKMEKHKMIFMDKEDLMNEEDLMEKLKNGGFEIKDKDVNIIIIKDKVEISDLVKEDAEMMNEKGFEIDVDAAKPNLNDVNFYPNPNDGNFELRFTAPEKKETSIYIHDLSGKKVYQKDLGVFSGSFKDNIDISQNPKGIYLMQVKHGDKILNKKIVVR